MTKYLLKRLLHGLISVIVMTVIVMVLCGWVAQIMVRRRRDREEENRG